MKPRTLEGDWDRFYLEFPDVYDRFASFSLADVTVLDELFGLAGKVIVDVGAGTGRSVLEIAKRARFVVGLEPWAPMRNFAVQKVRRLGTPNVAFVDGIVEAMPFGEKTADAIVSVYGFPFWFIDAGAEGEALARRFVDDAVRIVRPGGVIAVVGSAPGWGAGELTQVLRPDKDWAEGVDQLMREVLGFAYVDRPVVVDCGSVEAAVETYGFIYGQKVIDYLIKKRVSVLHGMIRVHYKWVEGGVN